MPALITHYIAAEKAYEKLKPEMADISFPMYLWGAQGPDIFFFHKPLNGKKSLREFGIQLHKTDPQLIFGAFSKYTELCSLKDTAFVYSYCYGFLSHLALDSTSHPYVYYFQDVLAEQLSQKPNFMHHKIEHNLDVILLKNDGKKVTDFKIREALPSCRNGLKAASKALEFMINEIFDTPVTADEIYQAFKDIKKYEGLLLSRRGRRRHIAQWIENKNNLGTSLSCFVRPEEPENDFDYANAAKIRWINRGLAGGRPSSQDFFSLLEKGVDSSVYLAGRFKDCSEHRQPMYFLKDYKFDNGSQKLEVRQWSE